MGKGPNVKVRGEIYTAAVIEVLERDNVGRPLMGRFMHEGETMDLKEATASGHTPEFIIVLANKKTWGTPKS